MKLQDISKKTLIIVLLIIVLLLYIFFYSNKQENLNDNRNIYQKLNLSYSNAYPQRGVLGFYIDTEQTRNNIGNVNFQQNQIFILYDAPNNKMMVFDFDNAIAIYDYNINNMTIYTPISKPNMVNYKLNITNNQENYTLNIDYMMNDGSGMGTGNQLNKIDLFNLNNLNNLLSTNNLNFSVTTSNFDPTQELQILQNYNLPSPKLISNQRGSDTNQAVQQNSGDITIVRKSNTPTFTPATATATTTAIATVQSHPSPNPLAECISQEVNQSVTENLNKLYKPQDTKNMIDGINGFLLNYNNYNIIKSQIDLFKTFTDDQIVCILESNSPNFCDNLDKGLSNDEHLNQLINGVKTSHEIMSLYQNQLLDIKTIVLPRVLNVINKCTNLTKTNKLKALNGLRDLLYTAEYISSILGNNWDLIKNIDNTIKSLN